MCGIVPECGHPNWNCVLRRCSFCSAYPIHALEEEELSIRFHHVNVTRCSIHGILERQAKKCLECEQAVEGTKEGKVRTRKHLTLLTRSINEFMKNYYLVALERYAYHLPHVRILSKNSCGTMRLNWFNETPGALKTTRDYAERMSAAFNFEAQHEHFGNDRDLLVEGRDLLSYTAESLEAFDESSNKSDLRTIHEFHSHFSDNSKQYAATTHAHMSVLFDLLKRLGRIRGLRTLRYYLTTQIVVQSSTSAEQLCSY
jgi:hypothetical protein